jgi:hypothetical protein
MTTAMRHRFFTATLPTILAISALLAATPHVSAQFSPFAPTTIPGVGAGFGSGAFSPFSGADPFSPFNGYGYNGNVLGDTGGALYGYSQVLKAYGQVLTAQEYSRIIREQSMQAKFDTARKKFDLEMYLRANTPSIGDEQARIAKNVLKRIQVASLPLEVLSGKAHNILLDDIRKFPFKKANMDPLPLNEEVVARLNVTGKSQGVGMLRDGGKLDWPTAFDFVAPETRAAIDRMTQTLVAGALQGKVDRQLLDDINGRMEEIKSRMVKMINDMPASSYIDGDRFLNEFQLARIGILEGQAPVQVKFQQFVKGGKTMQEIADYMVANGLKFSVANFHDDAAYRALHSAMVAFDIVLNTDTKTTTPSPAPDTK